MIRVELICWVAFCVIAIMTFVFQVIFPAWDSTPLFPMFRKKKLPEILSSEEVKSELEELDCALEVTNLEHQMKEKRERLAANRKKLKSDMRPVQKSIKPKIKVSIPLRHVTDENRAN